jgi:transcription elongation factor S-II
MVLYKIKNPALFRSNIVNHIHKILENEKMSKNLEIGIFNFTIKEATQKKVIKKWNNPIFVEIYKNKTQSVLLNLTAEIIQSIKSNAIEAQKVAFMTHQELLPEKWDELIKAKSKRDLQIFETNIEASTDTYTCRKCKNNKCAYYQMQTRSADEPMTTYVSCLNCGNRWKC